MELMKKYHLYDGIEMTDEDRLAALRPLLSSSEKGNVWIICLGSKQIGYIATCNCYSIEFRGLRSGLMNFISMNSAEDRDLAVRF
ncbi:putative acetyltransferase [Pseudomonas aeruginosa]|nr:putative acetyltransferase [Pseudomonas aeruginosa]